MAKYLKGWTPRQKEDLRRLVLQGDMMFKEIAEKLGRNPAMVAYHARKMGLPTPAASIAAKGKWNVKHAHLRQPVMEYFLTHTWGDTAKRFGLTQSELKSLFTVAYRDPAFSHLRKDRRTKDPWTLDDWLFMLRASGIRERGWIAKKLGKSKEGRHHAVKDRMKSIGAGRTKFLNGMPLSWAQLVWPGKKLPKPIRTKAGPTCTAGETRFRIIPWAECAVLLKRFDTDPTVAACIRAMAKYQSFIHGTRRRPEIYRRINAILRSK